MQFTLAVLVGAVLGCVLGLTAGRRLNPAAPTPKPSALSWAALGLGAAALLIVASGFLLPFAAVPGPLSSVLNTAPLSIVFGVGATIAAVWALVRRDRHWVAWTGLVLAALPTLFWVLFALGHLFDPGA